MTSGMPNSTETKLLPGTTAASAPSAAPAAAAVASGVGAGPITQGLKPARQLAELPKDELEHLAEDLGLDFTRYKTRQHLVAAIHERRQVIAGLDREAMLDVVR